MTPPLPSPPITAPTCRIRAATLASPTAARWQAQPLCPATSSVTRDLAMVITTGPAVGVEKHPQTAGADFCGVHQLQHAITVPVGAEAAVRDRPEILPRHATEVPRGKALLDPLSLGGRQHHAFRPEQFQPVPLG